MKILICTPHYTAVTALARQLARTHAVTVLTSRASGAPPDSDDEQVRVCRAHGWLGRHSTPGFLTGGLSRGAALLQEHNFDVINSHGVLPGGIVGHLLSRFYGIPNVLSVEGADLHGPNRRLHPLPRPLVRALLANADVLVGQTVDTLHRIREQYDVSRAVERIALSPDAAYIETCAARYEQVLAAAIDPLSRSAHLTRPAQAA